MAKGNSKSKGKMTERKFSEVASTGPVIIGEEKRKYWIGNKTEDGEAAMLTLGLSPKDVIGAFSAYAQQQGAQGRGLPIPFCFSWIFTSLGFQGVEDKLEAANEKNAALEDRIEDLEASVAALEARLEETSADG